MRRLRAQKAAVEGTGGGLIGRYRLPALIAAALTALGFAIRLRAAGESVFADELATYWIVSAHDLRGVLSIVHTDAEITPPLSFVLSWLTTRINLTPELLRAPALLAGTAAIPVTYLLGLRTVGRGTALVATALTAFAPFMIYYSAEARGYGIAILLVMLSTLAMLAALDSGRTRWWVAYAACTCAAVYTHYTTVFPLAAQLAWLLWSQPGARRPALVATAGAIVFFLPWTSGLVGDFTSPTTAILAALSPFTPNAIRVALEHWSIGYPYSVVPLREIPGVVGLILLALSVSGAAAAVLLSRPRGGLVARLARVDRRVLLVVALALSAPVGEALVSAAGTNLFGTRNLAVSWPGFALVLAMLLVAAGPRLRFTLAVLAIASFGIGAARMLETRFQRPDYQGIAGLIEREAAPGDVVIEGALLTPGPLTGMDAALDEPVRVFRAGKPEQRDHPFTVFDPVPPIAEVTRRAVAVAAGGRIFVVSSAILDDGGAVKPDPLAEEVIRALPAGYRPVAERSYAGFLRLGVWVYAPSPPG